jgi:hypothetical protein
MNSPFEVEDSMVRMKKEMFWFYEKGELGLVKIDPV